MSKGWVKPRFRLLKSADSIDIKVVHSSSGTTLWHPSRKHQDWFNENDEETQKLLGEKRELRKVTDSNIC